MSGLEETTTEHERLRRVAYLLLYFLERGETDTAIKALHAEMSRLPSPN